MSLEEETVVVVTTKLPEVPKGTTPPPSQLPRIICASAFLSLCAEAERRLIFFVSVM